MGKVGKGEESVGKSGAGASFKELTGRKGARKGRGVGGREGQGGIEPHRHPIATWYISLKIDHHGHPN